MNNPEKWFDSATINTLPLSAYGIDSLTKFTPNSGGVSFDSRAPLPTIELIPHQQRGSFAALGLNNNKIYPTNVRSLQVTLTLKEGTKQVYTATGSDNLVVVPTINYDVTQVTMQVLSTSDEKPATNVEIIVYACGSGLLQNKGVKIHAIIILGTQNIPTTTTTEGICPKCSEFSIPFSALLKETFLKQSLAENS